MKRIGLQSVRALVVDDEPDGRYVLVKLMRKLHCEAEGCADGPACLELAKHFRPELILLDLAMPGMDGFQVLAALEERHLVPRLAVALSGYGDAQTVVRCREAGFHSHELKPISFDRLQHLVAQARRLALEPAVLPGA